MAMTFAKVIIHTRTIVTFVSQQLWHSILNYYWSSAISFFFILLFSFAKALFPNLALTAHFPALNETVSRITDHKLNCQICRCPATNGNSAF